MPSTARRTRRAPRTRRIRTSLPAAVAVCAAALLCGGCAGARAEEPPGTSIEEIAAALGCTAEVSVDADELRQGGCGTGEGAYRIVTFADDRGLRSWLTEARMYGGTYLVGDRWVVTAGTEQALTPLRDRLGGAVETGSQHDGHPVPHGHHPPSGS
ncbi:hypothetical protein [Streptomyces sp. NPDC023588]|uniref:hypothetical protein n=1 Tax=Streptomyces sp. NPDC023588 TaxID=3154907 RepID=UPI0033C5E4BB